MTFSFLSFNITPVPVFNVSHDFPFRWFCCFVYFCGFHANLFLILLILVFSPGLSYPPLSSVHLHYVLYPLFRHLKHDTRPRLYLRVTVNLCKKCGSLTMIIFCKENHRDN
ncbi:hypothetical protein EGW08_013135 [Elysia chlorotica]|uniref:Uncharacterized protein n=1 Tax=Elysia chlorotica TaxID=188477 RepID=A0A433TBU5_ELYCH|nr:hypothetical protein EGW08_013135 [Elysia chlorotica]